MHRKYWAIGFALALAACPTKSPDGTVADTDEIDPATASTATGGGSGAGPSSSATSGAEGAASDEVSSSNDPAGSSAGEGSTASSGTGASSGGSTGEGTTGGASGGQTSSGGQPVGCGPHTYACGDLIDNDGDGLTDLNDPECTGPCDDDESSFQTGINGDNVDCKQDCFFDGNSGQGEGCTWDLRCDPANPGVSIGCEYNDGPQCNNASIDPQCAENCGPLTPPGCDCFGCCTVQTPEGPIDIFLNGSEDCSLDNLEACTQCTSQTDVCGNPCEPDGCEVCFGETDPPPGCDENECGFGESCAGNDDCGAIEYCYLGCCYPEPS